MKNLAQDNATGSDTSARNALRLWVLLALEANPELSQRQLPVELGVSLGGLNYALKALVERGFVKADNLRKSGSKVAYLYVLIPKGVVEKASLATAFVGRRLEEYEVLLQKIGSLKGEVGSDDWVGSGKGVGS